MHDKFTAQVNRQKHDHLKMLHIHVCIDLNFDLLRFYFLVQKLLLVYTCTCLKILLFFSSAIS